MKQCTVVFGAIILSSAFAHAQSDASNRLRPITGPIRNAGTYHLTTHTWTRMGGQASLVGTSTIYNNTCPTGFYSPLSTNTYVDQGRLPANSPNEPNDQQNRPGCATRYSIDGFQIGYCTDQTQATIGTYTVSFYESYSGCATVIGLTPNASFALHLPSAYLHLVCWLVTIDLDAPPQSASLAFTMQADGDGTFTGPTTDADLFGWSVHSTALGTGTGPIFSGNFAQCTGYDGTAWSSTVNYAQDGTGMSTLDGFYIEPNGSVPGACYHFGGPRLPVASFHLRLFSGSTCITNEPGAPFCFGDGASMHVPCPCFNSASGDEVGCLNSFGIGARLRASGAASISNDTLTLLGSQMPPTSTCLYFQGTIELHGGNGAQFGDGLRCAGGTVGRLGAKSNVAGASQYPSAGDPSVSVRGSTIMGQARTYQVWYRNSASFCTTATFNLSNGYQLVWTP